MPEALRDGWKHIVWHTINSSNEHLADDAAKWVAAHGEALGFRAPNVEERGRAMGLWAYLRQLNLDDQDLVDAEGDALDHFAVIKRIGSALAD